jgi:hypothetical protein
MRSEAAVPPRPSLRHLDSHTVDEWPQRMLPTDRSLGVADNSTHNFSVCSHAIGAWMRASSLPPQSKRWPTLEVVEVCNYAATPAASSRHSTSALGSALVALIMAPKPPSVLTVTIAVLHRRARVAFLLALIAYQLY